MSDSSSCKSYFKHGKSFPENVKEAICDLDLRLEAIGATGPTGPAGAEGRHGGGVDTPATLNDILGGINGNPTPTYVDPSGWYDASNRYSPLVSTQSIANETYYPDALEHNIFDITYDGSCVIGAPQNLENGRTICMALRQAGDGNNTLSFDTNYHFDGGYGEVTLTAGAKDVLVATKINDLLFTTLAVDCKSSISVS